MGCSGSKQNDTADAPVFSAGADRGKGSSIITAGHRRRGRHQKHGGRNSGSTEDGEESDLAFVPGTVEISKGGSCIMPSAAAGGGPGRGPIGGWRPGDAIERPRPCPRTQYMYITLDGPTTVASQEAETSHAQAKEEHRRRDRVEGGEDGAASLSSSSSSSAAAATVASSAGGGARGETSDESLRNDARMDASDAEKSSASDAAGGSSGGAVQLLQVTYGYASLQGLSPSPPQKPNQDSLVVIPRVGNRDHLALFGVFDGHGPRGQDASHFCRLNLGAAITRQKQFVSDPANAFKLSFPALDRELVRCCNQGTVEMAVSGSTAVAVLFDRDRLVCANVGDSRALLCSYATKSTARPEQSNVSSQQLSSSSLGGTGQSRGASEVTAADINVAVDGSSVTTSQPSEGDDARHASPKKHNVVGTRADAFTAMDDGSGAGRWLVTPLSRDHKPARPDERARIERTNARILSEAQLVPFGDPEKLYVCRASMGTIRYGVLFSRSIGDVDSHTHLGLTANAEVYETRLEKDIDRFLIVATDGVWDALSNEQAAAIVARYPRSEAQAACDALVEAARKKWMAHVDSRRDDITAVVVGIKWVTGDAAASQRQDLASPQPAPREGIVAGRKTSEDAIEAVSRDGITQPSHEQQSSTQGIDDSAASGQEGAAEAKSAR